MHRDIKPENVLCVEDDNETADGNFSVKLTDFGFATKYEPGEKQTLFIGTLMYMAPELCQKAPYNCKVDIWAVGVMTYTLLSGYYPFQARGKKKTE